MDMGLILLFAEALAVGRVPSGGSARFLCLALRAKRAGQNCPAQIALNCAWCYLNQMVSESHLPSVSTRVVSVRPLSIFTLAVFLPPSSPISAEA